MFLPSLTVWVTVPVFAFAPWNLVLMWVSSANAVLATRANTANAAMSVFFIFVFCNVFFVCLLSLVRTVLSEHCTDESRSSGEPYSTSTTEFRQQLWAVRTRIVVWRHKCK